MFQSTDSFIRLNNKMSALHIIFCVLFYLVICVNCEKVKKGSPYDNLPPIFHIDDYESCKKNNKLFCRVSIILERDNQSTKSFYWNLIEKSIEDKRAYNHNELFHAICTEDFCANFKNYKTKLRQSSEVDLIGELKNCYTEKYRNLGLVANITYINCTNHDDIYKAGLFDYLWLIFMSIYAINILCATYWDYQNSFKVKNECPKKSEKVFLSFSIISNLKRVTQNFQKQESQKLSCIQGIRFYTMLLIIFCHTYSSYIGGFVLNTDYIEEIPQSKFRLGLRNLFVFLVQTFFLFSGFLLSKQLFKIIDKTTIFNKRYILLTFLNRYLRIIPIVIVGIGFASTVWVVRIFYGPIKDLFSDVEYQRCLKNGWTTLFFINNHYNHDDMCYFITWYLAADTQLYILSLIVLSLVWKFPNRKKQILFGSIAAGVVIPIVISYIYDLDIIYRITPENSKIHNFRSFNFNATYSSMYANMATYMMGLCFGFIYYQMKDRQILNNMIENGVWRIFFVGLPTIVVTISSFYYNRLFSAILCGILRPLYALGIAIGILGMSRNKGGVVKSICEWRPATFMGDFTYSTYLVHYGIVFYRTATAKEPLYVSDFVLVTSFVMDALLSFCCGFLMHILVEQPCLRIQRILVPKARKEDLVKLEKTQ